MQKFSVKKKLNRLVAGVLSAAMALTMAPDISMTLREILQR